MNFFRKSIDFCREARGSKVYPFENFTFSPFEEMLGSWYPEFVHIHVFMGIHEAIENNQEDLKH